jgi:hypothetical protein
MNFSVLAYFTHLGKSEKNSNNLLLFLEIENKKESFGERDTSFLQRGELRGENKGANKWLNNFSWGIWNPDCF